MKKGDDTDMSLSVDLAREVVVRRQWTIDDKRACGVIGAIKPPQHLLTELETWCFVQSRAVESGHRTLMTGRATAARPLYHWEGGDRFFRMPDAVLDLTASERCDFSKQSLLWARVDS